MAKFAYKAKNNRTGEMEVGETEAPTKDILVDLLHDKDKIVVSVTEIKMGGGKKGGSSKKAFDFKGLLGVRLQDKIDFCDNLAALLEGGITLIRCLDIISSQVENRRFRSILNKVKEDVKGGLALHKAFSKHSKVFSPLWINLIETGEASGELPVVLRELSSYFRLAKNIRTKLTTALIYPTIVILAAGIAMLVFVTLLVPMFETLFESFGTELPLLTVMTIKVSAFIKANLLYILIFLIAGGIILFKYVRTKSGRKKFDRLKLSIPIFGPFFVNIAMVKFANSLGVLIKGGVPILYSLDVAKKVVGNVVISNILNNVKNDVKSGGGMADSLKQNTLIPTIVAEMIQVGEETGDLSSMLSKLTNFYREKIDIFVSRFSTIIEPILILFIGGIVAFLVASMFLPIFMRASLGSV